MLLLVRDHTYQSCWCNTNCVALVPCGAEGGCGPSVGTAEMLFEMEGGGIKQDCIPYVGQLEFPNVPLKE